MIDKAIDPYIVTSIGTLFISHSPLLISICVYALDIAGLGGMDAGAKPTRTYSWRPALSRTCA